MNQSVLAPALTEDERRFLYEQRNSEHFKIFAKAITWGYSIEAAKLVSVQRDDLSRAQGVLQGFLGARGIVFSQTFQGAPTEEELRRVMLQEQKTSLTVLKK